MIDGFVNPGFEPVGQEFAANFERRGEPGAACAAFHHSVPVVDLWGGHRDPGQRAPWIQDARDGVLEVQGVGRHGGRTCPLPRVAGLRRDRGQLLAGVRATPQGTHHGAPTPCTPGGAVRDRSASRRRAAGGSRRGGRGDRRPASGLAARRAAGLSRVEPGLVRGRADPSSQSMAPIARPVLRGGDRGSAGARVLLRSPAGRGQRAGGVNPGDGRDRRADASGWDTPRSSWPRRAARSSAR
jgi:hypothetical protein